MLKAAKQLFYPARTLDMMIEINEASVHAKDYLITVDLYDFAGNLINHNLNNWHFSKSLTKSFQYLPEFSGKGMINISTLSCSRSVGKVEISIQKWNRNAPEIDISRIVVVSNKQQKGLISEFTVAESKKVVK